MLASCGYDDLGRRTNLTRGNGTVTTYSVDRVSQLASPARDVAGSGQDVTARFTHLPSVRIASVTHRSDAYA